MPNAKKYPFLLTHREMILVRQYLKHGITAMKCDADIPTSEIDTMNNIINRLKYLEQSQISHAIKDKLIIDQAPNPYKE